ncbi:MAG: hypothetical protein HND42_04905 [Armatimonadetes bacterium]|nr:MAG: hypothetical protein EDM73_05145 [Armatimonadota bacterium]MCE7899373.1 hypothetical protein [Armatimonadetes bacterium ATM1]MDL1927948.1 DinB family protein [Fimbriimonadia bacterium ATM]MBC6969288.1 hypothetical protein [Armatimonadota bacterium]MBL1149529.1 hypothetical protein [Armatimonadota bacterium]
MSQTTTGFDTKAHLAFWARRVGVMFSKDLRHIPEDKFKVSPGGKARPIQDITAEVVAYNRLAAATLRGEEARTATPEVKEAMKAELTDPTTSREIVQASAEALAQAIESASHERLCETMLAPWGAELPGYAMANVCAGHMWYHDAQLNYFQALHGDDQVHWAEE